MRFAPVVFVALLAASVAGAGQALLFDETYTHTSDNSARNTPLGISSSLKGSHAAFTLGPDAPINYESPENYKEGHFVLVLDVLSKPSATNLWVAVCFFQRNYTCIGSLGFTKAGSFTFSQDPSAFYQFTKVDWSKPFTKLTVIYRDPNQHKLDIGQGFLYEPDYSMYFPLTVRVRVFAVAKGSTFVRPPIDSDAGVEVIDAGTPQLDAGGAEVEDAGISAEPDAGVVADQHDSPIRGGCQAAPGLMTLLSIVWVVVRRRV